jgi:hypothetical protein
MSWRSFACTLISLLLLGQGAHAVSYGSLRRSIARERNQLRGRSAHLRRPDGKLLVRTERHLLRQLQRLFDAWIGTAWGRGAPQAREPRRGHINCGTFVGRMLEHAGFNVAVRKLQRQPASLIIRSLAPAKQIKRLGHRPVERFVSGVEEMGPGLYLIGLDYHIGFLLLHEGRLRFIHASYYKGKVIDEPAAESVDIRWSRTRVVGKLLTPWLLRKWLRNQRIAVIGDW